VLGKKLNIFTKLQDNFSFFPLSLLLLLFAAESLAVKYSFFQFMRLRV